MPGSAVPGGEDRIGALPDDLLRRVLSFLTSRESVCTCVLARRWRDLWKSVPVVRVMVPLLIDREGEEALWFANSLLLLRDRAPLHEVDIRTFLHQSSAPLNVELWLRYAASCHARVLRVSVHRIYSDRLSLPNMTLVSQHLTVFNIVGVRFEERTLDFSSCPVLEIIWTRDFKWRHTFSKLKTLFLNEWCLAADFGGLIYFLEHSPILERLTLQLRFHKQQSMDGKDESYKPRKRLLVSTNLKVVKIKCHEEDERIHQIVKILVSLGVPPDHIDNQQNDVWSDCSSFEQE